MVANKEIKTVDVAGKTYAVGLFWQPVQNEKDYLTEIKAAVQTVGGRGTHGTDRCLRLRHRPGHAEKSSGQLHQRCEGDKRPN